jgi:hypothetical protein
VPDVSFAPNFKISDQGNELCITPDGSNALGTYSLQLEACVQPALPSEPVCTRGSGFEVDVWDLCTANEIFSKSVPGTMTVPQMQSGTMTVGEPWLTKYPEIDCGDLEYKVLYNGAPVDDDWVILNSDGEISMAPSTNNPPGDYLFTLAARMDRYRNITTTQTFSVTVSPCVTGLDMSGLYLDNQ